MAPHVPVRKRQEEALLPPSNPEIRRLNEELSKKNEELVRLANTDSLTGLLNRYSFGRSIKRLIATRSPDQIVAVAIVDLDRFKLINDTFGHNMGDEFLRAIGLRLRRYSQNNDLIARLGGDEFAFARTVSSQATGDEFARELVEVFREPVTVDGNVIPCGASVGLALSSGPDPEPMRLMRDADIAMYRAKQSSMTRFQVFDLRFRREVTRRFALEQAVQAAVQSKQFTQVYQPVFSVEAQRTTMVEALARWTSPALGNVSPFEFIPAIERLGLAIEFGRQTIEMACRQLRDWRKTHPAFLSIAMAVNINSSQLLDVGFSDFVTETIDQYGLGSGCLVLELTESEILEDFDRAVSVLSELRKRGFRIAIDDFGTGYSALAYLARLPANFLKIDKTFVQSIDHKNERNRLLTEIIVDLANRFGLRPIAEGVESKEQYFAMDAYGCDLLQGYFLAKPQRPADLANLVTVAGVTGPKGSCGIAPTESCGDAPLA